MASNTKNNGQSSDTIYWVIAIALCITGIAAPVGVVMIVLKLLGGKKRGRHPYDLQREQQAGGGAPALWTSCPRWPRAPRG